MGHRIMAAYKARLLEFDALLKEEAIDVRRLRDLCFSGEGGGGF